MTGPFSFYVGARLEPWGPIPLVTRIGKSRTVRKELVLSQDLKRERRIGGRRGRLYMSVEGGGLEETLGREKQPGTFSNKEGGP